jgi:carboxypeptidase Q
MSRKTFVIALLLLMVPALVLAQQTERVDLNVIHKIKVAELGSGGGGFGGGGGGRSASRVMDIMYSLTDRYGPRLTNSPQFRAAGDWAVGQLKEWGMSNVHLEKWTSNIPGWQYTSYSGHMVEPTFQSIIGIPLAWTVGTNGPLTGEPMLAVLQAPADLDKFHGKLKGKIVMTSALLDLPFPTNPLATRYTDDQLLALVPEILPTGGPGGRGGRGGPGGNQPQMTPEERQAFQNRMRSYLKDEGVLMTMTASARGESGTFFVQGAQTSVRNPDGTQTAIPLATLQAGIPQVAVTAEHYNRIARLLQHNVPVKLQFDIKTAWDPNTDAFNVVAEIPGTTKPNEVVMVGGHFDSWHSGTGATDNGVGSAVAMEAMRILKSLNLKMDRTVRMGLWGGEEEGLLGSRAYVKDHFADPTVMKPSAEHDNFAGYFNIDNGTGKIRGVYLQGNEMMRPIFETWFAALKDLTPGVITIRDTGGTDHQSFDAVGLPGFQFIQDPMDYNTRTHHSNMDVYDRIQPADLEQMAMIEASFIYNAATRPDKLPRKDLPPPQRPAGRGGRGGAPSGGN